MAHLHGVIGAILRDFTQAQHISNTYSASLSQEYRENPLLKSFTIPNAFMGEFEVELKYAVANSGVNEKKDEFDLEPAAKFMDELSNEIADLIVQGVSRATKPDSINKSDYLDFMALQDKFKNDFTPHLAAKLKERFLNHLKHLITPEGKLDLVVTFDAAQRVIEQEMLNHQELKIFSSNENIQTRTETEKTIHNLLDATLDRKNTLFPVLKHQCLHELDIIVASDELAKLPAQMIHTAKIKLNLREYSLSQTEDNGTITDQLLPSH